MPETLLRTKLFVPPVRPNLVSRPQLVERLNQARQPGHKLTLISAPARFGKSTLASIWLAESDGQAAWLSLDRGDNDPVRFWTYVIEVVEVHEELGYLLEHQSPNLHLVLITRANPPLPMARLPAHGRLVEIRAVDLQFSTDEADAIQ